MLRGLAPDLGIERSSKLEIYEPLGVTVSQIKPLLLRRDPQPRLRCRPTYVEKACDDGRDGRGP
eukprot:1280777-Pyramimonas_sp.AAC.1